MDNDMDISHDDAAGDESPQLSTAEQVYLIPTTSVNQSKRRSLELHFPLQPTTMEADLVRTSENRHSHSYSINDGPRHPTRATHIPIPSNLLRQRLDNRPTPDQLSEQRRNSTISIDDTSTRVDKGPSNLWQIPRNNDGITPPQAGRPVDEIAEWSGSVEMENLEPIPSNQLNVQSNEEHNNEEMPTRSRWRRV